MGDLSTETQTFHDANFGFAFNDFDFSDRVLHLEIIPDESIDSSMKLNGHKKRKRKDSTSYDDAKIVTLHITSAILAAKSPFFFKLFKNGMRESHRDNDVSLRINASEEAALMDLFNFMYGSPLHASSVVDLVYLLIAADKFEVTSCMRYSVHMLRKLPMSTEYALHYLELPSSVLMNEEVRPLIDEAKKCIVAHYKDFTKSQEEAMKLPLSAIEVVLGSEGLQVDSEDDVFDFVLRWSGVHYPDLEQRLELFSKHLERLISFPNMSSKKLKEVLVCPEFERERASMLVWEALFTKTEVSCGQHEPASKDLARVYRPRCVVYWPRCVVYFDLTRHELEGLSPLSDVDSQTFCLGGKQFYLSAGRTDDEDDSFGYS